MTAAAAVTEARARLALALPGYADRTGDPHPVPSGALPAFAVRLELDTAEPRAMGEAGHWREGTLAAALWVEPADARAAEAGGHALGAAVEAALLAAPADLGGAVWDIEPGAVTVDHQATERRWVALEVALQVRLAD
jgi:hypothetical protein